MSTKIHSKNIQRIIDDIQKDNTSGSQELAKKAAHLLIYAAQKKVEPPELQTIAHQLIESQPTMAAIFTLVNNMYYYLDEYKNHNPAQVIRNYCTNYINNLKRTDELISKHTLKILNNKKTIITHSYSSTILYALRTAYKTKKPFTVICTESRPMNEGILLAEKLGKNKIDVNLVVDTAIFSQISAADIILLGADAITINHVINKIGSNGIAIAAYHHNIPLYALCSTKKIIPKKNTEDMISLKNPDEILNKKLPHVTPINYYFDATQLTLFTGIITEQGIMKPKELQKKIKKIRIHKSLS